MRRSGGGLHAGIEAVVSAREWEGEKSAGTCRYSQHFHAGQMSTALFLKIS